MKISVLLFIFIFPTLAYADWSKKDTYRQVASLTLFSIDWKQTQYIATHSEFYETNLILGKYPSVEEVNIYFTTLMVSHTIIAYLLPSDWRKLWQVVWIGASFKQISNNYSIGIKLSF